MSHITIFSIFSFSFGNIIHKTDHAGIYFLGQFLRNSQVSAAFPKNRLTRSGDRQLLFKEPVPESTFASRYYFPAKAGFYLLAKDWWEKPQVRKSFNTEKEIFAEELKPVSPYSRETAPAIIFHPLLPYSFMLYFKDRQVAHVELMFEIAPLGSIAIKRKISSGNLEVDLLAMRYIEHYLFIQKNNFSPNNWQTVKIDLSAEND